MRDDGVERKTATGATSVSLLARVRDADRAAWVRLVELYGPLVYRWCLQRSLRGEDAAEVGQEVFAAVARSIQTFCRDRPVDSFREWLFTLTQNTIRNWADARVGRGEGSSGAGRPDQIPVEPDDSSVLNDRKHLVHRAIELVCEEFEPKTWEAFWRTTVECQPADAVAAELGVTREAVFLAKSRVRRRLLAEFGELLELSPNAR